VKYTWSLDIDATLPLIAIILGLATIAYTAISLKRMRIRLARIDQVSDLIKKGATAYLARQFKVIFVFIPILTAVLYFLLGWQAALTCIIGSALSLLSAYLGMLMIIKVHGKVADSARSSSLGAFRAAFMGGSVMGMLVPVVALAGLSILYFYFRDPQMLLGFAFGSSLTALFAQVGGGIYTKAADIGSDLVGKVEHKMPEDDPRNPGVIADLVGDNVGDCAGRGSDLFQSFSGDVITGMIMGIAFVPIYGPAAIVFPLILQTIGVIASNIGVLAVRRMMKDGKYGPSKTLNYGLLLTTALAIVGAFILSYVMLYDLGIFIAALSGIIAVMAAIFIARHYTSVTGKPVREIASSAQRGAALDILKGISYGMQSPIVPVIMILGAAVFSYFVSGGSLYAVAITNIGTDLMIGFMMSCDVFGPIVDNADGVAELSKQARAQKSLGRLDSVGNTMKAYTKALSMTTGTLTAVVVFFTFMQISSISQLDIMVPLNLAFLFIGAATAFLVSSQLFSSTTNTANAMVDEIRRQYREIKGLLDGDVEPDYASCIDISTSHALREMAIPGIIAIAAPVVVGLLFGVSSLLAFMIGITVTSVLLAIFFSNAGAAFDNAKKYVEEGNFGGKGSETHAAAVVGDTVGDPMKDVVGPSLVIFMKVVGMTALLLLPLLAA
jgi:K(+)-stimulated pyrophosphate-energized sodium pump